MNGKDVGGESDNVPCVWVWTVGVLENTFHLVAHSSWRTGKRKMEKGPEKSRKQSHTTQMSVTGTEHLETYEPQESEKET